MTRGAWVTLWRSVGITLLVLAAVPLSAQTGLHVDGWIEAGSGGFRFPDGSTQSQAWPGYGYGRVVVVAPTGGDFGSIQAALDSITDATSSNRALIRVAPGVFAGGINMKSYVDVEGSGQLTTVIERSGATAVSCADESELRAVTVRTTGSGGTAVRCNGKATRLSEVTLLVQGTSGECIGLEALSGAAAMLRDVEIYESSTCSSAYGVQAADSTIWARGLEVGMLGTGTLYGLDIDGGTARVQGAAIEMESGDSGKTLTAVLDQNTVDSLYADTVLRIRNANTAYGYRIANSLEPRIVGATGFLEAASIAYGVRVSGVSRHVVERSSFELYGAATGFGYGAYVSGGGTLRLTDFNVLSDDFAFDYGVYVSGSSLEAERIDVLATNGSFDYGIYTTAASGDWQVTVNHSSLRSGNATIRGDAEFTTRVGGSLLAGAAVSVGGGTIVCAGVWDENTAFSTGSCP